ncbi:alpha/beta fold hydrolase [Escherichia coli]|uniref:alpha/beta fold hydrolase n=1 Tax=Escherichia coli TaxID=562 RepID=UPI000BE9FEF1|nr:alpha/beta hydrolase [Escherichia coli]
MYSDYYNNIYYIDEGPYNGGHGYPAIFFIHDFLLDSKMFEMQVLFFSNNYRTICIDIRGFGKSNQVNNSRPAGLNELVDDVIDIANHLNINKFIICGVSEGGYIALNTGYKYQSRVCGIILIGTSFYNKDKESALRNIYYKKRSKSPDKRMIDLALNDISIERKENLASWKKNLLSYNCDFIERIHYIIYNDINNKKIIKNITQPVLIVYGEYDPYFTHYMIEDIQRNIKYPRIIMIPEGKTFININHSSSLNNIVKYWLNDYF